MAAGAKARKGNANVQAPRPKTPQEVLRRSCAWCGYRFPVECGYYGCPNCLAKGLDEPEAPERAQDEN